MTSTDIQRPERRFAIALSFPGQHRAFVRNVAVALARSLGKGRIFFDEWYEAEIRGSGADLKLRRIYGEEAELLVPFFSQYYSKMWCQIEWHAVRAVLAQRREEDAVVPVHLDNTAIPGWEVIDLGIRRKARESGKQTADQILEAYKSRPRRLSTDVNFKPEAPVEPKNSPTTGHRKRRVTSRTSARPIVVLMDSTLPDVVYDSNTRAQGGTNADDITDVLSDLPVTIIKETTSLLWRRDEQVLRVNPDLVVLHFSAFYSTTTSDDSDKRLEDFLQYMSGVKTRFLIYSRMSPEQNNWLRRWLKRIESRIPGLRNRIQVLPIKHGQDATFRNPDLARRLKLQVKQILEI